MMQMALPWWRDRSGRERALLAIMAALLGAVVLWLAVLRPLAAARTAAAARHAAAAAALATVQHLGAALRVAESRAAATRALPVLETVNARAATAGLTVESLAAVDGTGVRLVIAAVRPQPLLAWLADLERNDGLVVENLAIRRNDDATIAAQMTLRTPS